MKNAKHSIESSYSRRAFNKKMLFVGLGSLCLPFVSNQQSFASVVSPKQSFLISAQGADEKSYGLNWISNASLNAGQVHTGFRGHGLVQHPLFPEKVLMFARRPGIQIIEVNLRTADITGQIQCQQGRHLFGHGCFNQDGSLLFTSEQDYRNGNGKIVVRDGMNYQWLGEFSSGGIGPHEIKLLPDGNILAVANGGILTHPDSGRTALNLDTMDSKLSYIDLKNGNVLDSFKVPESKASIRHIDVMDDGSVVISMQVQREAITHNEIVPLGAIHKIDGDIQLLNKPEAIIFQMKDYMGSVAVNSKTRLAGFTSPRGNLVAFWNMDSQEFVGYHQLHDVCGIAVSDNQKEFILSSSNGQLRKLDAVTLKENKTARIKYSNVKWDNHLLAVSI